MPKLRLYEDVVQDFISVVTPYLKLENNDGRILYTRTCCLYSYHFDFINKEYKNTFQKDWADRLYILARVGETVLTVGETVLTVAQAEDGSSYTKVATNPEDHRQERKAFREWMRSHNYY